MSRTNPRVLQAELDRRRAEEQVRATRSALLPQVSLGATVGFAEIGPQRTLSPVAVQDQTTGAVGYEQRPLDFPAYNRGMFDLTLTLSQLIFDAGRWALLAQVGAQ